MTVTDLRDHAKGKPCMIRIAGYCEPNRETTVLAHLRMAGITGGKQKAPDLLGAWACSVCHDIVDGRRRSEYTREDIRRWHLEGIVRTQYALIREDKIRW